MSPSRDWVEQEAVYQAQIFINELGEDGIAADSWDDAFNFLQALIADIIWRERND